MLSAFSVCILLAGFIVVGVPQYASTASVAMTANVQAASLVRGGSTIRARLCGASQTIAITPEGQSLPECSSIETDPSTKAFITLFDGSTATLSSDTAVTLRQMQTPRFAWSRSSNVIVIEQTRGSARYGVAPPIARGNSPARSIAYDVKTPQFTAHLTPGSYSIEVDNNSSQISVREGEALVTNSEPSHAVSLVQGQSLVATTGEPLPDPISAAKDLIRDGDFTDSDLKPNWDIVLDQGGDGGNIDGAVTLVTLGDRRATEILRTGSASNSAITGIQQQLDKDVSDYRSLSLKADIRLHNQSLSGGGYLSTEYPLIILLRYRDVNGDEFELLRGFYYQNDVNNPTRDGEQIPPDVWVPFESGNLMATPNISRPFRLLYIRIYASGWDYESYVSGLQLVAE